MSATIDVAVAVVIGQAHHRRRHHDVVVPGVRGAGGGAVPRALEPRHERAGRREGARLVDRAGVDRGVDRDRRVDHAAVAVAGLAVVTAARTCGPEPTSANAIPARFVRR
jgi:hypothetical protein